MGDEPDAAQCLDAEIPARGAAPGFGGGVVRPASVQTSIDAAMCSLASRRVLDSY